MGVWVCIIQSFGIQNGNGRRQYIVRYMMVADDEVNSLLFGIRNLLHCFNAAVQHNDKSHSCLCGIVNSFFGNSVSFVVTVGDVIVKVRVELLNELVDQCHSGGAVHIVISINQNALFLSHCHVQAFHCYVHILHQEWIMQIGQLWTEEFLGILCLCNSPLHQKLSQDRANTQFLSQCPACLCLFLCNGSIIPFVIHFIYCFFFLSVLRCRKCITFQQAVKVRKKPEVRGIY